MSQKINLLRRLIFISVLLGGILASAQAVVTEKKWTLYDYSTPALPNAQCVAYTQVRKNGVTYSLELSRLKNQASPTQTILRQVGEGESSQGWVLTTNTTEKPVVFGFMIQDAAGKFFWGVPRTETLIGSLLAGRDLPVVSRGGSKEVKFDFQHDGFGKIWQNMQSRCSGSQEISNAQFEKYLLLNPNRIIDPLKLDSSAVGVLRSLFVDAHRLYTQRAVKYAELQALRERFKSILDEYEPLVTMIDQITQRDIPRLHQQQAENERLKLNSESELRQVTASLPRLQSELNQSQVALERAEQVIAPFVPDHENYVAAVSTAQSALSGAEARLSSIRRQISDSQNYLNNLDYELQRVEREVFDARSRLSYAQREYNDAEVEYRRFNPQQEERMRLQSNGQYQSARQQLPQAQAQLNQAQGRQSQASGELNRAQQELRQCQATAGADCSAQQARVSSAQSQLQQANSEVQQANRTVNQHQNTIRAIENQVRNEVRRIQDRLLTRVQRARDEVNRYESIISRGEQRARDIRYVEIPSTRSQIDRLGREASATESEIAGYQVRVRQTQRELEAFEARVGWNTKKSALDQAQADFSRKQTALLTANNRKSQLEQTIESCLNEKTRLAEALRVKTDTLNRSRARAETLKQELGPYDAEKSRIDREMSVLQTQMEQVASRFDQSLPN